VLYAHVNKFIVLALNLPLAVVKPDVAELDMVARKPNKAKESLIAARIQIAVHRRST